MSNGGINFKVYCSIGDLSEVKRFFVDADAVTSFVFMKEKLKSVFPNMRDANFKITWKDADGDMISITNDDDFITALTEINDNPKVLYVEADQKNAPENSPRQFQVLCDICQKSITGYRYKCIECPDYDLCAVCEGSGYHSEHMVLRIPNSQTPFAKLDRKMMHNAARALKKSVFNLPKCTRDKDTEKDKTGRHEKAGTNSKSTPYGCPFSGEDMGEILSQNLNPFIEMISKGMPTTSNDQGTAQNPISDILRSVAEAFTTFVNPEQNPTPASHVPNSSSQEATMTEEKNKQQDTVTQKEQPSVQKVQNNSAQPSAPPTENTANPNNQDMEWTIVSDEEQTSQASGSSSQAPTNRPPPLPQDPRLMRGLAQLYEMGFSNENQFLNYMLETHNYNVGEVVKAILELK